VSKGGEQLRRLTKSRVAIFLASCATLVVALFVFQGGSVSASSTNVIESTISNFENAYLAVFTPLPGTAADNSVCSTGNCVPSFSSATSSGVARTQFSDVAVPTDDSVNWTSSNVENQRFNLQLINARNQMAFNGLTSSTFVNNQVTTASALLSQESGYLSGNAEDCSVSLQCTVTVAAGANVLSFSNVSVTGTSATITAVVQGWQEMSNVSSTGAVGQPTIVSNELSVNYSLVETNSGQWVIQSRVGSFLPGQGP
jgi:hypothetical protein